jgi:hypothetical protein
MTVDQTLTKRQRWKRFDRVGNCKDMSLGSAGQENRQHEPPCDQMQVVTQISRNRGRIFLEV